MDAVERNLFILKLEELIKCTSVYHDLVCLALREEADGDWLYIVFPGDCQKKICITYDDNWAILRDLVENINTAVWLQPDELIKI